MKALFLFLISMFPMLVRAQAFDTIAAHQVDSLILVSRALTDEQSFAEAHAANEAAEKVAIQLCGKHSLSWANTCFNHGRILYFEGRYTEAEPWYIESKTLRAQLLGREHADYAKSLNNLAIVYDELNQFEKSEPLYLEVLAIRKKLFGTQNASYANALSNLASLYLAIGDYDKAETLNFEAKAIREAILGKDHPDYAASLHNLANVYIVMGIYDLAEPLYLESKAIREAAADTMSIDYLMNLDNLAQLYSLMEQYVAAENLFEKARIGIVQHHGSEHPQLISVYRNLANLMRKEGNYSQSELLFLQAQAMIETVLKSDDGRNLQDLVALLLATKQFEKAKPFCIKSNQIIAKKYGKQHEVYVAGLDFLAELHWALGDTASAKTCMVEASQTKREILVRALHYLSEKEVAAFTQLFSKRNNYSFSFAQSWQVIEGACYNDILFEKGFLLNAVQQVGKLSATDPQAMDKQNLLKSYHRLLAAEYAKPIAERSGIAELETKANYTEKELVRIVSGLNSALLQVNWQEVQAQLKPNEAAIEFVHYQFMNPTSTDSTMYAALVLLPDGREPRFVPLFEEGQLTILLSPDGKQKNETLNKLYTADFEQKTNTLYPLVWQPLEAVLKETKTVYVSATGLLHQVNLSAISTYNGAVIADRYRVIQLNSTRQLVTKQLEPMKTEGTKSALLFGGINYTIESTVLAQASVDDAYSFQNSDHLNGPGKRGAVWADTTLQNNAWTALPWTNVEVNALQELFTEQGIGVTLKQGDEASETALKSISGQAPSFLHLATHGFFYPAPQIGKTKVRQQEGGSVFKQSENPMIRSGLVLAGGNHAWKYGRTAGNQTEDGVLTAYEISQLDLHNTELVVLSACETGLGDIKGTEGVYGLQRAFKIAGAKYLIMSLWQVPDYQTQQLMTAFYHNWLVQKMSIPDAFRAAQSAMRKKYKSPFYWAGFTLLE